MEFHLPTISAIQNPKSSDSSSSSSLHRHDNNNRRKDRKTDRSGCGYSSTSGSTGVKLSTDPQSVAARERRHRISNRFKILRSMVPGGTKMDTVSMLDEAIRYVKFLKAQIWLHENMMVFFNETTSHSSNSSDDDIAAVSAPSGDFVISSGGGDPVPVMETYSQLMPLSESWFDSVHQETMP